MGDSGTVRGPLGRAPRERHASPRATSHWSRRCCCGVSEEAVIWASCAPVARQPGEPEEKGGLLQARRSLSGSSLDGTGAGEVSSLCCLADHASRPSSSLLGACRRTGPPGSRLAGPQSWPLPNCYLLSVARPARDLSGLLGRKSAVTEAIRAGPCSHWLQGWPSHPEGLPFPLSEVMGVLLLLLFWLFFVRWT